MRSKFPLESMKHSAKRFEDHLELTDKRTWVTKDGRRLLVSEMESSHLVSTIQMLLRWARAAKLLEELQLLMIPTENMGEYAADSIHDEQTRLQTMTLEEFLRERVPPFERMMKVANKRELL